MKKSNAFLIAIFCACLSPAYASPCLELLKANQYDYIWIDRDNREKVRNEGLEDFLMLTIESFPNLSDTDKKKGIIYTNISCKVSIDGERYSCIHVPNKWLNCGALNIHATKDSGSTYVPYEWNNSFYDYFRKLTYKGKEYAVIGINDGKFYPFTTLSDATKRLENYQPKLPLTPGLPSDLKVEKLKRKGHLLVVTDRDGYTSSSDYGGWKKYISACSPKVGSIVSHRIDAAMIPIEKYGHYLKNGWRNSIAVADNSFKGSRKQTICSKNDADCINRLRRVSGSVSSLLSSDDVLMMSLRVDVQAPSLKMNLSF